MENLSAILISNAIKNSERSLPGRQHDYIIKKLPLSLYIFSGPLAYNFLHKNMPESLPPSRTVQRMVHKEYEHITEGEFRFDMLVKHIEFYKAPKVIAIGEDATRVVRRVQYDPTTNRIAYSWFCFALF